MIRNFLHMISFKTENTTTIFGEYLIQDSSMYIDGLLQECSNSIANALELLQSCNKPSIYASANRVSTTSGYDLAPVQSHHQNQRWNITSEILGKM